MENGNKKRTVIVVVEKVVGTAFLAFLILAVLLVLFLLLEQKSLIDNADSSRYVSYKPVADDELSFYELKNINPDVIGWITLDDTKIDYPIVQGDTNEKYLNKDVFGEFSITGSIFLDCRNEPDFSDPLSIIYGHNMDKDRMFGGLDKFEDQKYFDSHGHGTLFYGGRYYNIDTFAFIQTNAHDSKIYKISLKEDELSDYVGYVIQNSVNNKKNIEQSNHILLFSTCSVAATDDRTLLAAYITPGGKAPEKRTEKHGYNRFINFIDGNNKIIYIIAVILFICLVIATWLYYRRRKYDQ